MHILYIHQHFATPKNSIGTRSYELSLTLIEKGHSVTMLCGDTTSATGIQNTSKTGSVVRENIDGIDVIRIMQPYANAMTFTQRIMSFIKFSVRASKQAILIKPDLIYATSTPLTVGIPAILCKVKSKAKFVFEVRDLWPALPIAMGVIKNPGFIYTLKTLEKRIYRSADAIVTLAPGMSIEINKTSRQTKTTKFIPNACDLALFNPLNSTNSLPDNLTLQGIFKLVYCGHHGKANGLDALLNAASELRERNVKDVVFVMIGNGSEKGRLVEKCKQRSLTEYFRWLDPMPKVALAKVLPCMDVGLMTLLNVTEFHNGTSPNKFFDYISCGLPVIVNYPGWIADLIRENQCGTSVSANDPKSFTDGIIRLKNTSPDVLHKLGASSRALAEREFSRSKMGEELVEFLQEVTG